jgi:uncharacterized protein (TIGR03067 family)
MRSALLSIPIALSLFACSGDEPVAASLVGAWAPQSAQLGGAELPIATFQGANLNLTADTYEFAGDKGSYVLVNTSTPTRIDILGKEGPNAGRTIQAIYELKDDQLAVCYQLGTGARPTTFESPAGTQVFLVRYQRVP